MHIRTSVPKIGARMLFAAVAALALTPLSGAFAGEAQVAQLTKTLPKDGTDVVFTVAIRSDGVLEQILADTYPTHAAGLCTTFTPGDLPKAGDIVGTSSSNVPDECDDSEFNFLGFAVVRNGTEQFFRPGDTETDFGRQDALAIRQMFSDAADNYNSRGLPLKGGDILRIYFDNEDTIPANDLNDIRLEVTVGVTSNQPITMF